MTYAEELYSVNIFILTGQPPQPVYMSDCNADNIDLVIFFLMVHSALTQVLTDRIACSYKTCSKHAERPQLDKTWFSIL